MKKFPIKAFIVASLMINFSQSRRLGIVGGETSDIRDYPFLTAFLVNGTFKCGGSILSKNFCLTAAHCVAPYSSTNGIAVRVGSTKRDSGGQFIAVSKAVMHPQFDKIRLWNDIALLQLSQSIIFSELVQPIVLQSCFVEVPDDTNCEVSGWGKTTETGSSSKDLRSVRVTKINTQTCQKQYDTDRVKFKLHSCMFCAAVPEGGKDACSGDSGGPLMAEGKQVGIVSSGFGCARPEFSGIYTKVNCYCDFIRNITKVVVV